MVDANDMLSIVKPMETPNICCNVPFQEIGIAKNNVSRRASSKPSPM